MLMTLSSYCKKFQCISLWWFQLILCRKLSPKNCLKRTAGELNAILESNLVPSHCCKGQLQTFCCIE